METRVESRVKHVFDGLSLVALGFVLLAMTLGLIEWSVLLNLVSLWPLLIVAAGIDLVGKSLDSGWVRALSSVVFIAGLAYAVFVMPVGGWPGTLGVDFGGREVVEFGGDVGTAEEFTEASARIGSTAGRLSIEGSDGAELFTYEGRSRFGEPNAELSEEGSSAVVTLHFGDRPGITLGPTRNDRLALGLSPDVLWDVKLESGVGELDANLSELAVSRLELDAGVGAGEIRLGDPEDGSRVHMDSGIASLKLYIPQDAEARVRFESGIGSKDLPESFEETEDGTWETAGYDSDGPAWTVQVQAGIGNLEIITY